MSKLQVNLINCLSDNYSYLIFNPDTKKGIVVDPAESKPVINELKKLNISLEYIFITHHHADHVGGNLDLKKIFNCKIVGFEGDANRIPGIDIKLKDKENFEFENETIQLNTAPGHTSGHVFYFFNKNKYAFVGDVVFSLGCGRIFEGTAKQMFDSVQKIKNLPDETKIFCGHEYTASNSKFCIAYDKENKNLIKRIDQIKKLRSQNLPTIPTTVLEEKANNIFFRSDNEQVISNIGMNGSDEVEIFKKLRELKDNF